MSSANHDEIVDLIGDVDELLLERLVATGASLDEISEAWCDLQDECRFAEERHLATSPRVAEVRSILEEVLEDIDDEYDELAPVYTPDDRAFATCAPRARGERVVPTHERTSCGHP